MGNIVNNNEGKTSTVNPTELLIENHKQQESVIERLIEDQETIKELSIDLERASIKAASEDHILISNLGGSRFFGIPGEQQISLNVTDLRVKKLVNKATLDQLRELEGKMAKLRNDNTDLRVERQELKHRIVTQVTEAKLKLDDVKRQAAEDDNEFAKGLERNRKDYNERVGNIREDYRLRLDEHKAKFNDELSQLRIKLTKTVYDIENFIGFTRGFKLVNLFSKKLRTKVRELANTVRHNKLEAGNLMTV